MNFAVCVGTAEGVEGGMGHKTWVIRMRLIGATNDE